MKDSPDQMRKNLGIAEANVNKYRTLGDKLSHALVNNAEVRNVTVVISSDAHGEGIESTAVFTGDKGFQRRLVEMLTSAAFGYKEEWLNEKHKIERELL